LSRPRPQPVNVVDLVLWVVAWLLVAGVVWSSLGPPPSALADLSFGDKLLHFGAYAATTGTFLLAAVWRPGRGPGGFPRSAPLILGAAIVLSGVIELAQGAFTSRTADAWDAVASTLGATAAWRLVCRPGARAR
jgi:hypothetical protein